MALFVTGIYNRTFVYNKPHFDTEKIVMPKRKHRNIIAVLISSVCTNEYKSSKALILNSFFPYQRVAYQTQTHCENWQFFYIHSKLKQGIERCKIPI